MKRGMGSENIDVGVLVARFLLITLILIFSLTFISGQVPELHAIRGFIHESDLTTQVPTGTEVRINATTTGTHKIISTSGPPGQSGFYSTTINAQDGESVIITALNSTNYGRQTLQLQNSPAITIQNLSLNLTRPAETNLTITNPGNNSIFDIPLQYDINFTVQAIGGSDSTSCEVEITIANPGIVNLTSGLTTKSIGDITLGSSTSDSFEIEALSEGTTLITLTSACTSDAENFMNLNSKTINIRVASQPLELHAIQGYLFQNDNTTQVPSNTNVTINLTRTGESITIQTSGPPGHTGFYSTTILATDNDEVYLYSQNGTYEGNTTINLSESPEVTKANFSLDIKKVPLDLSVNPSDIIFNSDNLIENSPTNLNATIHNIGRGDVYNLVVSFYLGDPDQNGAFLQNQTIPFLGFDGQSTTLNLSFLPTLGINNIFVIVDPPLATNGSFQEGNESNNRANNTITLPSWQNFYGNITLDKLLASSGNQNLTLWFNQSAITGNVFITDFEAEITWSALKAIGKNISDGNTNNDFSDLDTLLNTSSFPDSVSNTFTSDGSTPLNVDSFFIHQQNIANVPTINSTSNTNFITGILWDSNDDSNGEFDQSDSEDIVFVTKVNQASQGAYGTYDYEITLPVRLRDQNTDNSQNVYIYYDLN